MRIFAVVCSQKGHLKVTKMSENWLINQRIMKKEGTDKVSELANKEVKSTSRGENALPNSPLRMAMYTVH